MEWIIEGGWGGYPKKGLGVNILYSLPYLF